MLTRRLLTGLLAGAALVSAARPVLAQQWLVLQGIADGEIWSSDSGSRFLTRNNGNPGVVGRLRMFAGIAPSPRWQLVVLAAAEGGSAYIGDDNLEIEAATLKVAPSRALVFEAGKILSPVGAFAPRRLSPINPLIGEPDAYPSQYPLGAIVSGIAAPFDYRLAVINLPPVHDNYVPDPGARPRIVAGGGITPIIGVHFGATFSQGSYLNDSLAPIIPAGRVWSDYQQRVIALDGRVSRGYLDLHAEWANSRFDVPTVGYVSGPAYYVEAKYTWTPRFFTAARFQRNDYAFVRPLPNGSWLGVPANFYAGEVGIGVRLGKGLLYKASFQKDHWTTAGQLSGQAFATQLSYQFDVTEWLTRKQ